MEMETDTIDRNGNYDKGEMGIGHRGGNVRSLRCRDFNRSPWSIGGKNEVEVKIGNAGGGRSGAGCHHRHHHDPNSMGIIVAINIFNIISVNDTTAIHIDTKRAYGTVLTVMVFLSEVGRGLRKNEVNWHPHCFNNPHPTYASHRYST